MATTVLVLIVKITRLVTTVLVISFVGIDNVQVYCCVCFDSTYNAPGY